MEFPDVSIRNVDRDTRRVCGRKVGMWQETWGTDGQMEGGPCPERGRVSLNSDDRGFPGGPICQPVQETWIRSLARDDSTCHRGMKPGNHDH